jgi:hypothetical protein
VQVAELRGARQRPEVEDRDERLDRLQHRRNVLVRHVVGNDLECLIVIDQRAQAAADDVLEASDGD